MLAPLRFWGPATSVRKCNAHSFLLQIGEDSSVCHKQRIEFASVVSSRSTLESDCTGWYEMELVQMAGELPINDSC
jgi:hypothetical protein